MFGIVSATLLITAISLAFVILVVVVTKCIQVAFVSGALTALLAALSVFSPEKIETEIRKLECNMVSQKALLAFSSENRALQAVKASLEEGFPTVVSYDGPLKKSFKEVFPTKNKDYQILFFDLNSVEIGSQKISNEGPVFVFSSKPQNLADLPVTIESGTLVSLCQKGLSERMSSIVISSPMVLLDLEQNLEFESRNLEGFLSFPWGKVAVSPDLAIYTFRQTIDVLKDIVLKRELDSLEPIAPEFEFRPGGNGISIQQNLVDPSRQPNPKFEAKMKKTCSWSLDCKIIIDEKDLDTTVASLFSSKGGSITKRFEKSVLGIGSLVFDVRALNPVVSFVTVDGVEKIQTRIDLVLETNNDFVQNKVLKNHVITAVIQSNIQYDDDEWKIYAKDPKVIGINFSRPNRVMDSLRAPIIAATNGIAGDILSRVPVYDLNKSGGFASSVAGYLLDRIEINNSQLEITMSVF
ncbi:MAG: DUF1439 domain-containing protein [Bdellovibrionales bacterium]|nr:DUF1439 domain-containing protein [Bdellovibrionales bacterium]